MAWRITVQNASTTIINFNYMVESDTKAESPTSTRTELGGKLVGWLQALVWYISLEECIFGNGSGSGESSAPRAPWANAERGMSQSGFDNFPRNRRGSCVCAWRSFQRESEWRRVREDERVMNLPGHGHVLFTNSVLHVFLATFGPKSRWVSRSVSAFNWWKTTVTKPTHRLSTFRFTLHSRQLV